MATGGSPTAQQLFRTFLNEHLSPRLRTHGFKGSAGRYTFPSPSCWALVGTQGTHWNTAERVEFTVNLKVVNKAAWVAAAAAPGSYLPERPQPSTFSNLPFEETVRLAHTIPGNLMDRWWRITPSVDLSLLCDDLDRMMVHYGISWLHRTIDRLAAAG